MFPFFLFSLCHEGYIMQNVAWSLYYLLCAQVMDASPNSQLSSAHATIGGEQEITQIQVK